MRNDIQEIEPEKKIKFDPTINLGHIASLVVFLGAGLAAWQGMDKRVAVLEEARVVQTATDHRQDAELAENKKIVREDVKEINGKLDRVLQLLFERK